MAFVQLWPREGADFLPVPEVVRRLRGEFAVVDVDPDAGEGHVAEMIAATLRFSDVIPGKAERIARLRAVQGSAVLVTFADDSTGPFASCCVMTATELFFGSPDEVDGPARELVERAAGALGYELSEG